MNAIKNKRRTPEEQIADLEAQIERVRVRAAQSRLKKDPTVRHLIGAIKSIDKAAATSADDATRAALNEPRMMLAACLAANGAPVPGESRSGNGTGQPAPDPDVVLAHIADNPGLRSEQISGALGTDTGLLSPVLRELREQGSVSVDGKGRAMRYAIA